MTTAVTGDVFQVRQVAQSWEKNGPGLILLVSGEYGLFLGGGRNDGSITSRN